jgi:photosystem II stability/assembly factor-like uncharacterized protein
MLSRRLFAAGMAGAGLDFLQNQPAFASTGIAALDTAAIAVRNPSGVFLVAITCTPGNRLVAVGEHGAIIYSDDNGERWVQAKVPVNVALNCVAFATPEIGWAAGHYGIILNTVDGGRSWQTQLNGIQVNQLALQAAEDPSVATNPSPAAPMALRRAQHFAAGGPYQPFLTLLALSPQKAIIFGANRMTVLTNDGGQHWQDWSLHIYDRLSHNIYSSAVIGSDYYLAGEFGEVFVSKDGGATFLPLTSPSNTTLFGILGAKDGGVIVYGVAGNAFRSTDDGKTWNNININTQDNLTGGRVLNTGSMVLVNEAGLVFESTDNGATFQTLSGIQPIPFFDIQEAPDGSLIAVGVAGVTEIPRARLAS